MPSLLIHVAIANEYLKKNIVADKDEFYKGVYAPDILGLQGKQEKELSHFSEPHADGELWEELAKKVNVLQYLQARKIDNDYERGYFLHLITDYYFFANFIKGMPFKKHQDFVKIYPDYECVVDEIKEVYGAQITNTPWDNMRRDGEPVLFTRKKLHHFIAICANINLDKIADAVLNYPDEWKEKLQKIYQKIEINC